MTMWRKLTIIALLAVGCVDQAEDSQKNLVMKFKFQGRVAWRIHHPGVACPASLQEVADELGLKDAKDAWLQELVMLCGPEGKVFEVFSVGRDGRPHTSDDIKSW